MDRDVSDCEVCLKVQVVNYCRYWGAIGAIAIHHNHNRHSRFSITIPFTLYLFAHIGMQVKPNFTQKLHHQTRGILGK
jgi:hypothetical protein